jgi:hypothetical protein
MAGLRFEATHDPTTFSNLHPSGGSCQEPCVTRIVSKIGLNDDRDRRSSFDGAVALVDCRCLTHISGPVRIPPIEFQHDTTECQTRLACCVSTLSRPRLIGTDLTNGYRCAVDG